MPDRARVERFVELRRLLDEALKEERQIVLAWNASRERTAKLEEEVERLRSALTADEREQAG